MTAGPPPSLDPSTSDKPPTSGLAIAGFCVSFLCGLLGLILCLMARSEIARSDGRLGGEGWANWGVFVAICNMCLGLMIRLGPS